MIFVEGVMITIIAKLVTILPSSKMSNPTISTTITG